MPGTPRPTAVSRSVGPCVLVGAMALIGVLARLSSSAPPDRAGFAYADAAAVSTPHWVPEADPSREFSAWVHQNIGDTPVVSTGCSGIIPEQWTYLCTVVVDPGEGAGTDDTHDSDSAELDVLDDDSPLDITCTVDHRWAGHTAGSFRIKCPQGWERLDRD